MLFIILFGFLLFSILSYIWPCSLYLSDSFCFFLCVCVCLCVCGGGQVLEGYHATVFAYGMTGSGKTHTMVGNSKDPGIIPLSFEQIFKQVVLNAETTDYSISISYLEIYCEIVRDIIEPERTNLNIREDLELGVHIQGVSQHVVSSWEETKALLDKGSDNRAVTATEMNAESSRSHAVLIARVTREMKETKERSQAKLFLVDLAGSERIGKSGVTGVALEEAKAINLSLTTLGLCIKALVDEKKPHVPFRSSKLTRLLKESLGGKARTCLIVAVRPGQPHIEETLSALQFGSRARKIKVHASKNVHKNWKLECSKLEQQLVSITKRNEKMTRQLIKLKRKLRNGEGGEDYQTSDEEEDNDDEEEGIGGGGEIHGKAKEKGVENRRRQSLHAAKAHKQALALQLKEMQQKMESKLAEAKTASQSKEDEIEMYQLQLREHKKNSKQLQNVVAKLQEDIYGLELETTELKHNKEKTEAEVESLECKYRICSNCSRAFVIGTLPSSHFPLLLVFNSTCYVFFPPGGSYCILLNIYSFKQIVLKKYVPKCQGKIQPRKQN